MTMEAGRSQTPTVRVCSGEKTNYPVIIRALQQTEKVNRCEGLIIICAHHTNILGYTRMVEREKTSCFFFV